MSNQRIKDHWVQLLPLHRTTPKSDHIYHISHWALFHLMGRRLARVKRNKAVPGGLSFAVMRQAGIPTCTVFIWEVRWMGCWALTLRSWQSRTWTDAPGGHTVLKEIISNDFKECFQRVLLGLFKKKNKVFGCCWNFLLVSLRSKKGLLYCTVAEHVNCFLELGG